jgi:DNA-binding NarL/FixJ family response regulator
MQLIFLTQGEKRVLDLIMLGQSDRQIAKNINMSHSCVKDRKRRIFLKYEVNSVPELIIKRAEYIKKHTELPVGA